jgi:hypothetical protein
MGVGGQRHAPTALPPGKRTGTNFTGGRVGPRTGLDGCGKSRTQPGFDPRTVQPVVTRYTDCAIPAPCWALVNKVMNIQGHIKREFLDTARDQPPRTKDDAPGKQLIDLPSQDSAQKASHCRPLHCDILMKSWRNMVINFRVP